MRDLVVREALKTMSKDAAKRLRELVAAGHEIPYEVQEPGNGSPLCQYAPLTERFIRENVGALRELDSFGAACAAIDAADLAGPYLEELGAKVPPEPRRRAELAGIAFLCRMWGDSTDFTIDGDRIRAGIAELEQGGGPAGNAEIEVGVPLRGFQMPAVRLELATTTIVRADTVEVPPEARLADGSGPWEPTFLAVALVDLDRQPADGEDPEADRGLRAVEAFTRLITTLRLFKPGGVSLGPHAWVRMPIAGGERWRRISTGAGRARPGGYRLLESELDEVSAFSRAVVERPAPFGRSPSGPTALARAISRFEAGLERGAANEALNDYLLALRFMLEGGGPAELDLGIRVASLCAEPERRGEVKSVVDRALALERELWSGEPAGHQQTPAEIAAEIEDLTRAILKDAACGHLGGDLRATADEILLADGLSVGEGSAEQLGETAEWDGMPLDDDLEDGEESEPAADVEAEDIEEVELLEELRAYEEVEPDEEPEEDSEPVEEPVESPVPVEEPPPQPELWLDGVEDGEDEVTVRRTKTTVRRAENIIHRFLERDEEPLEHDEEPAGEPAELFDEPPEEEALMADAEPEPEEPERERRLAILEPVADETSVEGMLQRREADRQEVSDRVAYLFPRPETCEWDLRELGYDRRRNRATAS